MANTQHTLQLKAILDTSQLRQQVQQLNSQNTINLDSSGIAHSLNTLNTTIQKFSTALDKLAQSTQQASQNMQQSGGGGFSMGGVGKFAAGMLIRKVGSSASEYFDATGNSGASQVMGLLGKVGGNAMAGASAGGIYGAVAGAAIGLLEGAFDILAENAKAAAEALKNYQKALDDARQKDEHYAQVEEGIEFDQMMRRGRKSEIQQELAQGTLEWTNMSSRIADFQSKYGSLEQARVKIQELQEERKNAVIVQRDIPMMGGAYGATHTFDDVERQAQIDKEIEAIEASIAQYEKDQSQRLDLYNKNVRLESAIQRITDAEERYAKTLDDERTKRIEQYKKEKEQQEAQERKIQELNQKRIAALGKTEEQIFERDSIQQLLKDKNLGAMQEELARRQYIAQTSYEQYKKAAQEGRADDAEEYFKRWIDNKGYASSLRQSIHQGTLSGQIDDYQNLLNSLTETMQIRSPVSELQSQGFGMGWVDAPVDSIEDNVSKIANRMIELIGLIRKTEQEGDSTLW